MLKTVTTGFHIFSIVSIACVSCGGGHQSRPAPDTDQQQGKTLAASYCQSCHMLPDPSLLDKKTWITGVLPAMGPHLGIFAYGDKIYPSRRSDPNVSRNYYPSQPIITFSQWQSIIDYYASSAPDTLAVWRGGDTIRNNLDLFSVYWPSYKSNSPASCFVKIDPSTNRIIVCDAISKKLVLFDKHLRPLDSIAVGGPIVDIDMEKNKWIICNIGNINPNDEKLGSAEIVDVFPGGKLKKRPTPLFDKLARPVQIAESDLNKDGKMDYLVCEFGNLTGALSWMENLGNGKFKRRILRAFPGTIHVYVDDYNHDGLPDIWALFAQGEEGIFLFTNRGHGNFDQREVLRFPPVYGSSSFSLADLNGDGFPDIIYTCGDNADFSRVLKPYHGVYVFLNDGKFNFKQKFFFHIDGCYKAIAKDFDGDGKPDIATISFFGDYKNHPEEGFVFLHNKGNLQFEPQTLSDGKLGRWLTMDAGDLNGNGKNDIILGNFAVGPSNIKSSVDWKNNPPFILLENIDGFKH
ncbi:MAG TPA: VCBS repeat-containing protein [Puia sp.]|nr:VCBS repeat-containing protein [Puia sp.]